MLRAGGKRLAKQAYLTILPVSRATIKMMPSMIAKPMALRRLQKIAQRYLNANVRRVGQHILLKVPRSVTLGVAAGSQGCTYYEATLRELIRLLIGSTGSVEHVSCEGRGEGMCEWKADWRGASRSHDNAD